MRGDSLAMGVIAAATTFLPVLVARLGGTALEIGMLTVIPAISGFLLAIPVGQALQRRTRVVTSYATARMLSHLAYGAIAVAVLVVPEAGLVPAILIIWAVASVPSTIGSVLFPIVMDGAAGPRGRLELMSRRWAIMGLTAAIAVAAIGQALDRTTFPVNYAVVFVGFSIAGLVSFYFSNRFLLPEAEPPTISSGPLRQRLVDAWSRVRVEEPFLRYSVRQLVYVSGTRMALPLVPLYIVRSVGAPDGWIGGIATGQSLALLFGYVFWRRQTRLRGTRGILLITLIASSLYPGLLSLVDELVVVAVVAAAAALFTAGVDLILFDELMRTVPRQASVVFVSIDTTLVNLATIVAPLVGAAVAGLAGLEVALWASSILSLASVVLFARAGRAAARSEP